MKKPLIALLMLISLGAHSQGPDNVMQFSIKEAIDFSFQHQKDVLNSQLDVEIANSQVKETIGMGLPQISASFDVKDYVKIPVSLIPAEFFGGEAGTYEAVQFGTQWNATAGLSASQLIFEPSYLVGVQAAKTFKELSIKNHDRTKLETAVSVTKAYYMVLLMRDRKNVIDANVSRLQKYNSDIKAMFENGFVEKVDVDRIQVTYNNVLSEQEKFQRLIEITEGNLKLQMGLPQASTINLTDSLNAEEIKTIVKEFKAELHVLHVHDDPEQEYKADTIEESGWLQEMFFDIQPKYHLINNNNIEKGIEQFAEINKLDMLIVVPKKHNLLHNLFFKSHSKQLVLHSHVPVLAVHE